MSLIGKIKGAVKKVGYAVDLSSSKSVLGSKLPSGVRGVLGQAGGTLGAAWSGGLTLTNPNARKAAVSGFKTGGAIGAALTGAKLAGGQTPASSAPGPVAISPEPQAPSAKPLGFLEWLASLFGG